MKKNYLGPKQHPLLFGPDVVHLQPFSVLSDVGVGMEASWTCGQHWIEDQWVRRHLTLPHRPSGALSSYPSYQAGPSCMEGIQY